MRQRDACACRCEFQRSNGGIDGGSLSRRHVGEFEFLS